MIDLTKLVELPLATLYEIRTLVNNRIEQTEAAAFTELSEGRDVPNFELKEGRATRYIKETAQYESVLQEAFEDRFEELCVNRSLIPLTTAEKLVKAEFDAEDAKAIKEQIQDCLGTKVAASKLVYKP